MQNALTQYTDLYRDHRELIESGSCEALNRLRPKAYQLLQENLLPQKGSENYEHTDLNAILGEDYGLNLARIPLEVNPLDTFRCGVPNMSTSLFMLLNDSFAETAKSRLHIPREVVVGSLRTVGNKFPELLLPYLGRIASDTDPLVELNTLLAQDGFVLYVPKGVRVEQPIQLVNILQNGMPLMAVRRLLVVLEEGAEATLLTCDHTQNDGISMLSLQTVEIYAGRNAHFELYDLEESTPLTRRISSLYLDQEEGSRVVIAGMTLYNGLTRNEYHCNFRGRHADLKLLGMAIEDEQRHIDTYSVVNHNTPECHTSELFKYVLDQQALGAFAGLVKVEEGAVKTEAYQANRNIVGSDEARMYSKPQLEIYNDDVKCSHGSATGRLDFTQLFYLRSRGIPEAEAKLLLKQAFMSDVIDAVQLPMLRERLLALVERRFSGEPFSCSSCLENCHH